MISVLKPLKSLIKLEKIRTDNVVFKLHYKVTVIMLMGFTILLSSKQFFGEPIICDVKEDHKAVINTFCWIYGTFIVRNTLYAPYLIIPNTWKDTAVVKVYNATLNDELPGLGLDPSGDPDNVYKLDYYQWVCIVFSIQAIMFYVPRYLWKIWENGRLRLLLDNIAGPVPSPNWNTETRDKLIKYLLNGRCEHNLYVLRYAFCEFLNFFNVVVQIYFLDWFVTGNFSMYGIAYASYRLVSPMNSVFPKMTKCLYYKYGPSGDIMYYDTLCILPLNVLNEKFFLVLWYWLFYLLFVSFCMLVYRVALLTAPKFQVYLLRAQTRNIDKKMAQTIVNYITFGDFFLLYKIGENIDPIMYTEFVEAIYEFIADKDIKIYLVDKDDDMKKV